jgi:transposase
MQSIRLRLAAETRKDLERMLRQAEHRGDLRAAKRVMAILSIADGHTYKVISGVLGVSEESLRIWYHAFLLDGLKGLRSGKSPGRKPKLTKSQKQQLDKLISEGPQKAGYPGACWRSPMIQHLILDRFGIFYCVNYISQLLKSMDFSYQKAGFVSNHKNPEKREEWLRDKWPEIYRLAKQRDGLLFFGDEVSFPQWGSLSYTWAKKGVQPKVMTSGIRKGYKVFGLIEYFSGKFVYKCQECRFTSETYSRFLKEVLDTTDKHIILVQDGARYHTSKAMGEFFAARSDRLSVYQLPAYSPDYNPIEKLWKEIKKDGIHLHYFPTFQHLTNKVHDVLPLFVNAPHKVLSLFGFYKDREKELANAA